MILNVKLIFFKLILLYKASKKLYIYTDQKLFLMFLTSLEAKNIRKFNS